MADNKTDIAANNKRIAKNTFMLYARMLITTAVGLYTSRVVIHTLGVSDYGVFNIVGGVIGMLGYVNTLFASGVSRFLTIGLGENNPSKLKVTFSTTVVLTLFTASLVLLLGETIGLWFVNYKLNVDPSRMSAVNWVYQCALFSSALTIAQAPFTASIIAHEKMNIYAYMSIFDAIMKLLILYLLLIISYDKLIIYAILLFAVNVIDILVYRIYCVRKFAECAPSFKVDKKTLREMLSYSGFNMIGSLSAVCMNYGVNIVINIFFGTVINAARGVSLQISNVIQQLYSNFQLAGRPQVMKYYAQGDLKNMFNLMCNNGKYCALLLLCPMIPLFIYVDGLLHIWLIEVPDYTVGFLRWALLYTFFRSLDEPLTVGIHAVGRMKLPNLTSASINMLILPLAYIMYKHGGSPLWGAALLALFVPLCTICNFWILGKYIHFPWKMYVKRVFLSIAVLMVLASIFPLCLYFLLPQTPFTSLWCSVVSGLYVCSVAFFIGLPKHKRTEIIGFVMKKLKFNKI